MASPTPQSSSPSTSPTRQVSSGGNSTTNANSPASVNPALAAFQRQRGSADRRVQSMPISGTGYGASLTPNRPGSSSFRGGHRKTYSDAAQPNFNSNWVSQRGAWTVHVLVIIFLKIGLVSIPGVSDAASWTLTLLIYDIATFFMFHWTLGTPFQYEQGDFDSMTLWEQIDQGEQYTDTKKYLTAVPVLLYFLAIHYTAYDLTSFIIVTTCTIINMIGKMPYMHNRRIFGINKGTPDN